MFLQGTTACPECNTIQPAIVWEGTVVLRWHERRDNPIKFCPGSGQRVMLTMIPVSRVTVPRVAQ